ncbi:hypothetical protein ABQX22_25045 [Xanthomonas sp. WHRI 1810A]|uniref:hypothetical protein n=1 Tax=Xanthomonas sp. WHRI 1810A TaxID=3161565 RepID=UPI0032E876D1
MYVTRQEAYVDLSEIGADGLYWSYVEHSLHTPWFYITLSRHSDGGVTRTMLETMDPYILAKVICSPAPGLSVSGVMLVTPAYVNGTETWQMEKLLEYTQCHFEEHGSFELFRVPGKHYYTPQVVFNTKQTKLKECVFYRSSEI